MRGAAAVRVGRIAAIWRYAVKSMGGESVHSCDLGEAGLPGDRAWAVRDERAGEIRNGRKLPELLLCRAHYPKEPGQEPAPAAEILLPDGTRLRSDDPAISSALSRLVGRPVTFWPLRPADDLDHYRRGKPDHADLVKEIRELMDRLDDEPLPDFSRYPGELAQFASPPGTYFDSFPVHLLTTASLHWVQRLQPGSDADPRRFRPNFVIETERDAAGPVEREWCGRKLRIGAAELHVEVPTVRCAIPARPQRDLPADPELLRTIVREMDQDLGVYASVTGPGRITLGDPVELA
jgi:uncharacterized protein YcbX